MCVLYDDNKVSKNKLQKSSEFFCLAFLLVPLVFISAKMGYYCSAVAKRLLH